MRQTLYKLFKTLEQVSNRHKVAKRVDPSKQSELDWLNKFLEENGSKEAYGSTYERLYHNYKNMLEKELAQG